MNYLLSAGEGQFGEVWKASAPGIVPGNQSRNVVAVKKLKGSCHIITNQAFMFARFYIALK